MAGGEGDAAALVECRDALAALSAQAEPDLAVALRLALRRDRLLGTVSSWLGRGSWALCGE